MNNDALKISNLYDLNETIAAKVFEDCTYPWEVLAKIGDFIVELGNALPEDEYEKRGENMEDLYKAGKIKAIGVSNFNVHHLETLSENWTVVPAVNQIEIHPYYANIENVEYAKKNGIAIEAYSPLGGNGAGTLENEVIIALADKYGKTPAQIVLRWELQRGIIVLPKSTHQERIISNFDVFDFELSEDDMNAINKLNKNEKHGSDPETFNF